MYNYPIINYGFYSKIQEDRNNQYILYELMDGRVVHVTEVTSKPYICAHKNRFPDSVYMGVVKKHVRTIKKNRQ